jgi:hypothetical protein
MLQWEASGGLQLLQVAQNLYEFIPCSTSPDELTGLLIMPGSVNCVSKNIAKWDIARHIPTTPIE